MKKQEYDQDIAAEALERHKKRLARLKRTAALAADTVVEHPYRLVPSLGVTAREKALFALYREYYNWTLDAGVAEITREIKRTLGKARAETEADKILLEAMREK